MALTLVTGGVGFVGRSLTAALAERGERVRVVDLNAPAKPHPGVEYVKGSVTDPTIAAAVLRDVSRVYHLAGIAHLWRYDKADFDRANRIGTETMLRAARDAGVERFVHCSTESILLPKKKKISAIDESSPPDLRDMPGPYTRSKCAGEQAALAAARDGLDVVVVNPTVPVGAGDTNMTPPAAMIALFLSGGSPFFLDCVLNLVDVRDLAGGMIRAGDKGRGGERYILGGENYPLRDLLQALERISGRRMPKRAVPPMLALATGYVAGFIADRVTGRTPAASAEAVKVALRSAPFDSGKAKRELGYAPKPVEEALAASVEEALARAE